MSLVGDWHHPVDVVTSGFAGCVSESLTPVHSPGVTCGCCSVLLSRSARRAAGVGIPIISWLIGGVTICLPLLEEPTA